jgi:hypothetical protein
MAKSIFAPQHKHYRLFDIPSLDIHLGSPHYGHVSKRPMKLLHITTKEKGVWKIFHNSLRLALQSSHSLHILFDRAVKQRCYSRLGCNFGNPPCFLWRKKPPENWYIISDIPSSCSKWLTRLLGLKTISSLNDAPSHFAVPLITCEILLNPI